MTLLAIVIALHFNPGTMEVINTVTEIKRKLKNYYFSPVGLVPTMGALHEGHLALVRNAISECPLVVISIYINPTQFNEKEDLNNYPRTLKADLNFLNRTLRHNDIVFTPSDKEIYPVEDKRSFKFGNLDNVMEALHRPGHFNGVAKVVSRLFEIVQPDIAYFGLKDFQQVAVIKELVKQTGDRVRIAENPIIREPDGLAMSSRNRLLQPAVRAKASMIFKAISAASEMIKDHEISHVRKFVIDTIEKTEGFFVEYFEIVDDEKLIPVTVRKEMKKNKHYYGCIAVRAGKIRLIDNVKFPVV